MPTLTIGSRRSLLAQAQTRLVQQMLKTAWPDLTITIQFIDTQGDLNRHDPLPAIGGKGLFTLELEKALLEKRIDLAVHSLKDLPVEDSLGLAVVAIPIRASVHDMLICRQATCVADLPQGAVVGTSSLRRAAQLQAVRSDVRIRDIRGNVDTRLRKLDDSSLGYTAIILAQAGLSRLEYQLDYAHPIPYKTMLPAPGQGALGIQGRADDAAINRYLEKLNHAETRMAVTAERAFLAGLGGGCSLPVGALGQVTNGQIVLEGLVAEVNGTRMIRVRGQADQTAFHDLGKRLADDALNQGAANLL